MLGKMAMMKTALATVSERGIAHPTCKNDNQIVAVLRACLCNPT